MADIFSSDIKLPEKEGENNEWVKKFNHVSDLWDAFKKAKSRKEQDEAWDKYLAAKMGLEMGY